MGTPHTSPLTRCAHRIPDIGAMGPYRAHASRRALLRRAHALSSYHHAIWLDQHARPAAAAAALSDAAAHACVPAQVCLAALYEAGRGVAPDYSQAFTLYTRAAETDPAALARLARLYRHGLGTAKDPQKTVALLRNAIQRGLYTSYSDLADCFRDGFGVEKDPAEALRLYRRAVEAGSTVARVRLADCFRDGFGLSAPDPYEAFESYSVAARAGEKEAYFPLAKCYDTAFGVAHDPSKALTWYTKAADEAENCVAMHIVADFHFDGLVTVPDREKAVRYYEAAVLHGYASSKAALADCCIQAAGTGYNPKRAFGLYRSAMEDGVTDAFIGLGECYLDGAGTDRDISKGLYLLERAVNAGSWQAHLVLAKRLSNGDPVKPDFPRAFNHYKEASGAGCVDAHLALAHCFFRGKGTPRDPEKAVGYYRKASDAGSVDAAVALAHCYMTGTGTAEDCEAARELYRDAAAKGDAEAKLSLAHCYVLGKGCIQNFAQARNLLLELSEADNAVGTRHLARFYCDGKHIPRNAKRAAELYEKASALGDVIAMRYLATYYALGRGVQKDMGKALAFFEKAAALGDTVSQITVAQCHEYGHGVDVSIEKATEAYEKAVKEGGQKVEERLASCYVKLASNEHIVEREASWLRSLYEQGNKRWTSRLAYLYYKGLGIPRDYGKAIALLEEDLSRKKSSSALELLAQCYMERRDVAPDGEKAEALLKEAINLGSRSAMVRLGMAIVLGKVGSGEKSDGLSILNEAAEKGWKNACFILGDYYYRGHFMNGLALASERKQDFAKAVEYYDKAGTNAKALFRLAMCHWKGRGAAKSKEKAIELIIRAAEMKYPRAQFVAALQFENGSGGVEKDLQKAFEFHKAAASSMTGTRRGHALYNLSLFLRKYGDKVGNFASPEELKDRVHSLMMDASGEGAGEAANDAAVDFERKVDLDTGDDEGEATSEAFSLFVESAETGVMKAQANVGICYEQGIGTCRDMGKARHYYERAVNCGDVCAGNNLALCLEDTKEVKRAIQLWETAASKGDTNAIVNLGRLRERGVFFEKDEALAFKLYSNAAEKGNVTGIFNLATCFESGIGVLPDPDRAQELYRKAMSRGHSRARERLKLYTINAKMEPPAVD